jgi:hypothetical protein
VRDSGLPWTRGQSCATACTPNSSATAMAAASATGRSGPSGVAEEEGEAGLHQGAEGLADSRGAQRQG